MAKIIPPIGELKLKTQQEAQYIGFYNVPARTIVTQDWYFSKYRWAFFNVSLNYVDSDDIQLFKHCGIDDVYFDSDGKIIGARVWFWNPTSYVRSAVVLSATVIGIP